MKKHMILIELDRFRLISSGALRHHILHRSFNVATGDLACFYVSKNDGGLEFCTEITFVDNDLPGVGSIHFIISFKLL